MLLRLDPQRAVVVPSSFAGAGRGLFGAFAPQTRRFLGRTCRQRAGPILSPSGWPSHTTDPTRQSAQRTEDGFLAALTLTVTIGPTRSASDVVRHSEQRFHPSLVCPAFLRDRHAREQQDGIVGLRLSRDRKDHPRPTSEPPPHFLDRDRISRHTCRSKSCQNRLLLGLLLTLAELPSEGICQEAAIPGLSGFLRAVLLLDHLGDRLDLGRAHRGCCGLGTLRQI